MLAKAITASSSKKLILVDGSGFIFRAYHSLPPLTRPDGTPVGAVYGYMNMIYKLIDGLEADEIIVVFDAARKTFRNDIYPEYKAHRPDAPEDLVPQFSIIKEATRALNLPSVELEGFEADDIIATYARIAHEQGMEVIIVSSDKDLMQLIRSGVSLFDAMKNKVIDEEVVMEKFGVTPDKVIDVQSLIGDSTDNVPGVPGIGPKTAAELIQTYGTLDGVLENAGDIKQNKRRENLINFADQARVSRQLVTLRDDVDVPYTIQTEGISIPDAEVLIPFLREQGFTSLVTKYAKEFGLDIPPSSEGSNVDSVNTNLITDTGKANYTLVQDVDTLDEWIKRIRYVGRVAVDTETTSLDALQAGLVGISLSIEPGEACYIPVGHVSPSEQGALFDDTPQGDSSSLKQINTETVIAKLKPILEDPAILKIGQNIKYDMLVLHGYGVNITPIDDTMVLSYVLDGTKFRHNMDDMAERHLSIQTIKYEEITGKGKQQISFAEVPLDSACRYAAEDADITLRLYLFLKQRLFAEHRVTLYETIERPLIPVLAKMEATGITVNTSILTTLSKELSHKIEALEIDIHKLAGRSFTIGSPKQLGEVLFDELGIDGGKKSKTGAYATGAEILDELAAQGHIIAEKVLEWRQFSKLRSTYTEALVRQVNPNTKRVHTNYMMTSTSTGRLSSNDPNLQNIPVRTEEGRKIRQVFIPAEGYTLLSADYSQIELRLLADMAGIDTLKEAFRLGRDIHSATASQMFGIPLEQVDSDYRRKAKTINFGIIYGISAFGLAARLGIDRKQAADYIEQYFAQYPGIRAYMERSKEFCREHGYVESLFGRRCYIEGINDKNGNRRSFAERAAINAPLQGTAADIIKRAMIQMPKALHDKKLSARLLLQVHDELVFEVPHDEIEATAALVKNVMESAAHLSIPLTVEVGTGKNWAESH